MLLRIVKLLTHVAWIWWELVWRGPCKWVFRYQGKRL